MAEKILNTRILNKIDTLEAWNSSSLKIKKGEICLATVAASAGTGLTEPVVMAKIGTAEEKTFSELPWSFYAKASDVLAACKSEAALKTFINGVIADAGIATSEAMNALAGRVTTAEGEIDTLQSEMDAVEAKAAANETAIATLNGLVGDTEVATQISNAIAALNLADTYAAKTHGHEIADVNGLADSIAAAKKAGTDANSALEAYKTTNDAAVKVVSDAVAGIKNGETLDNFKEVEEALAGKQAAGNYSVEGHKHEIADVNGLSDAIADAKKAGTDAAGAAAQALVDAKAYTDDEMERLVGDKTVGAQITEAITGLDLANTYDAKGAAAAAETAAKGHADSLNTAMNTRVAALEAIDHDHSNKTVLDGITAEKVAAWDAAEQNAKDYADGLDEAMDGRVAALEAKFTGEDSVADQIADAVATETSAREEAVEDLQGQITANDGEIAALQGLVGDKKVSEAIADAVKVEKERAEGIEGGLETRLAAVEADYLKAADKKALQDQIDANESAIELLTNGVSADEVDGVNDLIQYVKDHGTEVTGMQADIKANADAIDGLHTVATTGSWNDLEDKPFGIGTKKGSTFIENRTKSNIGNIAYEMIIPGDTYYVVIDGVEYECIAWDNSVVLDPSGALGSSDFSSYPFYLYGQRDQFSGYYCLEYDETISNDALISVYKSEEAAIPIDEMFIPDTIARVSDQNALAERVTANEDAIAALEDLTGGTKVSDAIAAVTNPMSEKITALEGKAHEHANKAELDKFVDGDKAKLDAAVQTVTAGTGLKATKTGTDVAIDLDETVTFIFDCGTSAV